MRLSRPRLVLVGGILLLAGACGGSNVSHGPPAINQDALIAKWQAREKEQLFQNLEFKADKSFQLTLWQLPTPITGTYSWTGNNTVALEFGGDTLKAGKEALETYRQHVRDRSKAGGGQYEQQITASASLYTDDLLDKQDWRVGLVEGPKAELTLHCSKGLDFTFKKPE
jgi:hypothetical protein